MVREVKVNYDMKREYEFYEMLKQQFHGMTVKEQIDRLYLEVTKYFETTNKKEHEFSCHKSFYKLTDYPYIKALIVVKDIIIGVRIANEKNEMITLYYKEHKPVRKTIDPDGVTIDYLTLALRRK